MRSNYSPHTLTQAAVSLGCTSFRCLFWLTLQPRIRHMLVQVPVDPPGCRHFLGVPRAVVDLASPSRKSAFIKCCERWKNWKGLARAGPEGEGAKKETCTLRCVRKGMKCCFPFLLAKPRAWKWNYECGTDSRVSELAGHFQYTLMSPAGTG